MKKPHIRRRQAALAAAALLTGCASDGARASSPQPRRAAGRPDTNAVVLQVPIPCPSRPGDIVGLVLEGPSDEGVVVFGQAFRPGDLPNGAPLAARLTRGPALAAQVDALALHDDGSVRHALVSVAGPRLGAGERREVMLSRGEGARPSALDPEAALAGREAVVEIAPLGPGRPWRADLLALWRAAQSRPWQQGPLAVQKRVAVPVPAEAVGGVSSVRLLADLSLRADGTLWVDLFLRNDVAMRPDGGNAAYTARLLLDGQEKLRTEAPQHFQYTGWGRLRGSRRGSAAAPAPALVRHDAAYLAATNAIAPYDLTTGVRESVMAEMAQLLADPRWDAPFFARGIRQYMGDVGGRPDLGLTTMWQAAWIVSGDPRAVAVATGQAETSANVPWNFWDPAGGQDGGGGWLDVRRWPRFWVDPRGGRPPRSLAQPVSTQTGWSPVVSHHPDLSYIPYLLTGRRSFWDNLGAQAAWCVSNVWPAVRNLAPNLNFWPRDGGPPDAAPAQDVLISLGQARSVAWGLRTVGAAGWIAPEGDPNRSYFREVEGLNYAWLRRQLPEWTQLEGEAHGYIAFAGFGYSPTMTPFGHEYIAAAIALAARRGQQDARAVLDWKRNFLVGRFFAEDRGFERRDAVAYRIAIGPTPAPRAPAPPQRPFGTWREMGEAMRQNGLNNGDRWRHSQGEYSRLALLSLAMIHHTLGDPKALEAYDWLLQSGAPGISPNGFTWFPQHNIVPANRPRVPSRAGRGC